jgi:hypothetical protein
MKHFKNGQLVRLCRPNEEQGLFPWYDVSVFIQTESNTERKLYPVNTIGMIVEQGYGYSPGVYQVLIGKVMAIVSDSFIKPFDPDEVIQDYIFEDFEITDSVTT